MEVPILFLGDTHGDLYCLERACKAAKKGGADLIVQVGDWGYLWPKTKLVQAAWEIVEDAYLHMIWIDGNHDWHPQLYTLAAIGDKDWLDEPGNYYCPRGDGWTWQGLKFVGLGGAPSIDKDNRKPGKSWWPEENLTELQVERALEHASTPTDVLVTHDAPFLPPGISGWPVRPAGFDELAQATRDSIKRVQAALKPRLLVHGHYHVPGFATTAEGHVLSLAHNYDPAGGMKIVRFSMADGQCDGMHIEGHGDPDVDSGTI